jgi:inhibitor of KinA
MGRLTIRAAGDSAIFVGVGTEISGSVNRRVRALAASVQTGHHAGILEVVPAYASLMIRYDPRLTDFDGVVDRLSEEAGIDAVPSRRFVLPVAYGGEFGPDLDDVARLRGLTADEVIQRHTEAEYLIYGLGFAPGFPFLGGLDPELHTPRLETPRSRVPAGSVAIGGEQTGVYPTAMPGGWRIIGRCPLTMFDPHADPPVAYGPGDRIRFQAIDLREYERMAAAGNMATVDD